jgi:hypothetical protein
MNLVVEISAMLTWVISADYILRIFGILTTKRPMISMAYAFKRVPRPLESPQFVTSHGTCFSLGQFHSRCFAWNNGVYCCPDYSCQYCHQSSVALIVRILRQIVSMFHAGTHIVRLPKLTNRQRESISHCVTRHPYL